MNKYVNRFLCLLMAICMISGFGSPMALAMDTASSDEMSWKGSEWASVCMSDSEQGTKILPQAQIIVNSGVRIGVQEVVVYPAKYDQEKGQALYSKKIFNLTTYASPSQTRIIHISPEKTNEMLTDFKAAAGEDADTWIAMITFYIYTDGKGSYGKYLEMETIGNCTAGESFRQNLQRNTFSGPAPLPTLFFSMPEDTSKLYDIGVQGALYFYNAETRKTLAMAAAVKIRINSPY